MVDSIPAWLMYLFCIWAGVILGVLVLGFFWGARRDPPDPYERDG